MRAPYGDNDLPTREIRDRVARIYAPALDALQLSPDALFRVEALIAERLRSVQDAEDLAKGRHLDPDYTEIARAYARDTIDDEIASVAGAETSALVRRIGLVEPQMEQIDGGLARELASAGDPLTARQTLALAEVLKVVYAEPALPGNPNGGRVAGLDDKTGLGDLDRKAMAMASGILSPFQREAFGLSLATATLRYAAAGN